LSPIDLGVSSSAVTFPITSDAPALTNQRMWLIGTAVFDSASVRFVDGAWAMETTPDGNRETDAPVQMGQRERLSCHNRNKGAPEI
jgi:hypothetical protein